jgi:hypothetical protein
MHRASKMPRIYASHRELSKPHFINGSDSLLNGMQSAMAETGEAICGLVGGGAGPRTTIRRTGTNN